MITDDLFPRQNVTPMQHTLYIIYCRLAEVVANKLRLEEDGQGDDGMTKELSESARAMRESSLFQQMASQRNRAPQEVCAWPFIYWMHLQQSV